MQFSHFDWGWFIPDGSGTYPPAPNRVEGVRTVASERRGGAWRGEEGVRCRRIDRWGVIDCAVLHSHHIFLPPLTGPEDVYVI